MPLTHDWPIFIAPAIGVTSLVVAAAIVLSLPRLRRAAAARIRTLHQISKTSSERLDFVAELESPFDAKPTAEPLRLRDVFYIYLNSRENLRLANQAYGACIRGDAVPGILIRKLVRDHRRVRGLFLASAVELLVGRVLHGWYPMYADALLWTYSEEQELLRHLSVHCHWRDRELLLARI